MATTAPRRPPRRFGPCRRLAGLLLVSLHLGACVARDSGPAGIREVAVRADAVHVLSAPDGVTRIVDLQPLADGSVWVLNSAAPYFVVVASDGRIERTFGDQGGGPGEFGAPWVLVRGAEPGDVWTYDVRRSALIRISGEARSEIELQRDSVPPSSLISFKGAGINQAPPWLERTRHGFVVARDRTQRRESALQAWTADILLLQDDGRVSTYSPVADLVGDPASRYGDATTLLPYPVWTTCSDGTVGLYDPLGNRVRHVTAEGRELSDHRLPVERRVEVTADRVFEMFYRQLRARTPSGQLPPKEDVRTLTREQNEELANNSAGVFPEYADMHCTSDGALWIRPFDPDAVELGQGSEWIRLPAGDTPSRVVLPTGFKTFRIERDRIWGTMPDAVGVEAIAWVGLAG